MVVERITKLDYQKLVVKKCEDNHLWINKMTYISPTDEQKIALANVILQKLQTKETQIPSRGVTDECEGMRELAELTPMLYMGFLLRG